MFLVVFLFLYFQANVTSSKSESSSHYHTIVFKYGYSVVFHYIDSISEAGVVDDDEWLHRFLELSQKALAGQKWNKESFVIYCIIATLKLGVRPRLPSSSDPVSHWI